MARVVYRGNLKVSSIPFLSEFGGQSVIIRGQDQSYVPGLAPKEAVDTSLGIPQIYYAHNVIPTDNGYRSIGYETFVPAKFPEDVDVNSVSSLRDASGNFAFLTVTSLGNIYVNIAESTEWIAPTGVPVASAVAGRRVTVAYVSGVSYIFFAGYGCFTYDFSTNAFVSVTLAGLDVLTIQGLVGNKGYLLAYSEDAFAWSSTVDVTDFVPSLVTGAGGGKLEGAKGTIVHVEQVYGGIIIFCTDNAIAAIASGNARYPYTFTEITGAGGLTDYTYVTNDVHSGALYAYTTYGLQKISLRQADSAFPEVTDFLSGGLLEDFNTLTNTLVQIDTDGVVLKKKLAAISNRYLIISYGLGKLTHALYYDLAYKQWGKLKLTHTDCFEYNISSKEVPKNAIAFLTATGEIKLLNSDVLFAAADGVMITGKYQLIRSRLTQLQEVVLDNVEAGSAFSLSAMYSLNGSTTAGIVTGHLFESAYKYRKYLFNCVGTNVSLLFKGGFNAVSLVLTLNIHGRR